MNNYILKSIIFLHIYNSIYELLCLKKNASYFIITDYTDIK